MKKNNQKKKIQNKSIFATLAAIGIASQANANEAEACDKEVVLINLEQVLKNQKIDVSEIGNYQLSIKPESNIFDFNLFSDQEQKPAEPSISKESDILYRVNNAPQGEINVVLENTQTNSETELTFNLTKLSQEQALIDDPELLIKNIESCEITTFNIADINGINHEDDDFFGGMGALGVAPLALLGSGGGPGGDNNAGDNPPVAEEDPTTEEDSTTEEEQIAENQAPESESISKIIAIEDTEYGKDTVSDSFTDPDAGDTLTYSIEGPAWLKINTVTGSLSGTPGTADVGETTIIIRATDPHGATTEQTVLVEVLPIETELSELTTPEDTPISSVSLISTDEVIDYSTVQVENGTVVFNSDGTAEFTPDENFFGLAVINFQKEVAGETINATVAIDVTPVNDLVEGTVKITYKRDEETGETVISVTDDPSIGYSWTINGEVVSTDPAYPITDVDQDVTLELGYIDNDGNPQTFTITFPADDLALATEEDTLIDNTNILGVNNHLTIVEATSPDGTVTLNDDGTIDFDPTLNFNGSTTINYKVTDGQMEFNLTKEVFVNPVNDVPFGNVYINGINTTGETLIAEHGIIKDADGVDEDTLVYSWFGGTDGTTLLGTGRTYDVQESDSGNPITLTVSYTDMDGTVENLSISQEYNYAPVVENESFTVIENSDAQVFDLLGNDHDPEGSNITIGRATSPNGAVSLNGDGTVTFTPALNFNGETTITYTVVDNKGVESIGTSTVIVTSDNSVPTGGVIIAGKPIVGETLTATNNIDDADGMGEISYEWFKDGVSISTTDTYTMTDADIGATITVKATYTDGGGEVEVKEASIDYNYQPVANDDTATLDEDGVITISVLNNDSDQDGDELTITEATATNGTVNISGSELVYRPFENYNGTDTIIYTVSDGISNPVSAMVSITVLQIDDAPMGTMYVTGSFEYGETLTVTNDLQDIDGMGEVTYEWFRDGVLINSGDTYVIGADDRDASITIKATYIDGDGNFTEITGGGAQLPIFNLPPEDNTISLSVMEDDSILIKPETHITDPDLGDIITVVGVSVQPENGTVELINGQYRYSPNANFHGTDQITFIVQDAAGAQATLTTNIDITPVNDDPAGSLTITGTIEDGGVLTVSNNITDNDGVGVFTYEWFNGADFSNSIGTGETYILSMADEASNIKVKATYTDGDGNVEEFWSTTQHIQINNTPIATDDSIVVDEDSSIVISVLDNDTDADGNPLTITSASALNGKVAISEDGQTITYTPAENYNGSDTIVYSMDDGGYRGTATGNVSVTVNPINDAPTVNNEGGLATDINTPITFNPKANDSDIDGDTLNYTSYTSDQGTVQLDEDGNLVFTPTTAFTGVAEVHYALSDGEYSASGISYISVDSGSSANYYAPGLTGGSNSTLTALVDGGFVVSTFIYEDATVGREVKLQKFDANGKFVGDVVSVNTYTTSDQSYPQNVAMADGGWITTWLSYGQDGSREGVYGQRYNADGSANGEEFHISTNVTNMFQKEGKGITFEDGSYMLTWWSYSAPIYAQKFDADGTPNGEVITMPNYGGRATQYHDITYDADFIYFANTVARQSGGSNTFYDEVMVSKIDRTDGSLVAFEYLRGGTSEADGGNIMDFGADGIGVIYTDITSFSVMKGVRLAIFNKDLDFATHTDIELVGGMNFNSSNGFAEAELLANGNFVLTWVHNTGGDNDVFHQIFDSTGNAVSEVLTANISLLGSQTQPSLDVFDDGSYAISWSGLGEIYIEKFDQDGNSLSMLNANLPPLADDQSLNTGYDSSIEVIDVFGNNSPIVGDTLLATDTITDVEGVTNMTYTWFNEDGVELGTGNEYVVANADVGLGIYVVASYIDSMGTPESTKSEMTTPVLTEANPYGNLIAIVDGSIVADDGIVEVNDDGTITFTPSIGFSGETHIYLKVSDGLRETDVDLTVTVDPQEVAPQSYVEGDSTPVVVMDTTTYEVESVTSDII